MKILEEIEKMATEKQLPIIGSERGEILVNAIKKYKPKKILEIGTLVGYSAILMANAIESDTKILTVEIDDKNVEVARRNISKAGLTDKVTVIQGDALEVISKLEGKFDFLFIDAQKNQYLNYLLLAKPRLTRDAIIVADNVKRFSPKMQSFLEYMSRNLNYKCKIADCGYDALEICKTV